MLQPTTRAARRFACSARVQGVLRQGGPSLDGARRQPLTTPQRCWFSATPRRQQSDDSGAPAPSSSSEVPWYLRVDVPRHPTLVPEDQPLPAIPEGAPALMQPLLSFVAEDLGLDELALLDLRALDPPAALGPDLLMVFGTARSDRHLHVSADRLVRWLRGRGIHASADGLMGRNELKIKLRRKARRAKLMGLDRQEAAAAAAAGGRGAVDDGITTQWVCVHAGTQQGPASKQQNEEGLSVDAEGRTSGFGRVRPGTTVVVQMLTEAKRQQLDLETLWTRALARSLRQRLADGEDIGEEGQALLDSLPQKQQGGAKDRPSAAVEAANGLDDEQPILTPSSVSWAAGPSSSSQPQNPLQQQQQRREFSVSARRPATTSDDVVARLTQPQLSVSDLSWIEKELGTDRAAKVRLLEHLTVYLGRLRKPEVLEALGLARDHGSKSAAPAPTPFVRAAQYCMDGLPAADTWAFRAWLHATMLDLAQHRAYTLDGLEALVQEMERGGLALSRDLCAHLLQGVFAVRMRSTLTLARQTQIALRLLRSVHERGEPVLANDFLVAALASLARANHRVGARMPEGVSPAAAAATEDPLGAAVRGLERVPGMAAGPSVEVADMAAAALAEEAEAVGRGPAAAAAAAAAADPAEALQTVLERLQRQARLGCPDDAALQQLLRAYALQGDWARFWATWRQPAQHGRRRGEALYAFLFGRLAQTRHRARCTEALRDCVPEMLSEDPPVQPVGAVLAALRACVAVADPHAAALAQDAAAASTDGPQGLRLANREFVKLLRAVEAMGG